MKETSSPLFNPAVSNDTAIFNKNKRKMNYRPNLDEQRYGGINDRAYFAQAVFQQMYERAMRFSMAGSHIGDYSKEILEDPSKHYEGKMPKKQPDSDSNYRFPNKTFSIN